MENALETTRTRKPLSAGTIIRLPDGFCCQITGPVISEGGGGIIYPVSRVRLDEQGVHRQGMEYALKECFPLSSQHRLLRREDGAIVSEESDEQGGEFLDYVKKMQLAERDATSHIYHTAFRMVPTVESATEVELSFDEGRSFHVVENVVTVMESLAGKGATLQAFLADNSRGVPALVALRIAQQVLYALREVHDARYLHLDIQDGNILLQGNLDDGSIQATLIDFGSARPLLEDGCTAPISDRALFSTRGFSAPEMARNDGTLRLGPQADLYSVGYLLLLLLTGTRYDPRSLANVRGGRVLTAMRMQRTQCPAHLQGSLQSLLQKALAQEPAERYAFADEMLRDVTVLADALVPKRSDLAAVAYDAFISYRHNERDGRAAATLQQALEHYRIPAEVRKAAGKERFDRVFLDEGELSSCANLGVAIQDALVSASWLIVICSPDTPQSPWVAQEIDTFLEHHDASHVLAVLTAGEPDESFPERLRAASREDEMLAADARADTVRDMEKIIRRDTVMRVAAPMLGVSYDALKQRRRAWQLRRGIAALAAVLVVALAFIGVVWQDNLRIQQEYANAQVRESRYLAQESQRQLFDEDNRLQAVRTALQALPSDEQQRPYVAEAELALSQALRHYYPDNSVYYETTLDAGGEVADVCISSDLRYVTVKSVVEDVVWVSTWDPDTGSLLWKKRLSELAASQNAFYSAYVNDLISIVKYAPGTDTIVAATYRAVAGIDAGTGAVLWNIDLFSNEDHSNDGALFGVAIPESGDTASDRAYLFYTPEANAKRLKIDAISVADGQVEKSIDADIDDEWVLGYSTSLFSVAPARDCALLVCSRKDGTSDCVCVNMEDSSTASSRVLAGFPMDVRVWTDEELREDWFVATYEAGVDDETPGTAHYARIEKATDKGAGSGRSWTADLPLSHGWSDQGLSRSHHPTIAHGYRKAPLAFQFGQHIMESDGSISPKIALAADHDIYAVHADSGEIIGHEVSDAAVVGCAWGLVNGKDFPYLYYSDGGIDPFLVSKGFSQKSLMDPFTDVDGDPLYLFKLHDDLLLQQSERDSAEGKAVSVTVSANAPSLVKIVENSNDEDSALASIRRSEDKVVNDIALSAQGDYLCIWEASASKGDSDEDSSGDSAAPVETGFVSYETQSWQELSRCEVDKSIKRVLGVTADGSHVLWQEKLQPGSDTGGVWQTELATGKSELLSGLDAGAAHYVVSIPDAEDGSMLMAVLSYEEGKERPYTARLYRDLQRIAEMPLPLETDKDCVFHDWLKRESPLALSEEGTLAFSYRIDKQVTTDVFVNLFDQTVCMVDNPVASNSPADARLSKDGAKYATADSDGVVRIRNTGDGSPLCSYALTGSDLRGLAFIANDALLAMYTADHRLITIDAGSGEVVSEAQGLRSLEYEAYLDTFSTNRSGIRQNKELLLSAVGSKYHDISLYETERDLILYTAFGEGCIIDRESMAVRGYAPHIVGYSLSADALLIDGGVYMFALPVFSAEDLVAEGEELLAGDSPSAAGP